MPTNDIPRDAGGSLLDDKNVAVAQIVDEIVRARAAISQLEKIAKSGATWAPQCATSFAKIW